MEGLLDDHIEEINFFYMIVSPRRRLVSFFIDAFIVILFLIISIFILWSLHDILYSGQIIFDKLNPSTFDNQTCLFFDYSIIFIIACIFGYYTLSEYFTGKTLGKFLSNTKIITTNGRKPQLWNIILRTFIRFTPFCFFFFSDKENPIFMHDKISNTIVVRDD